MDPRIILDELEKLAKSSYSQSTVHVEIGELLNLIRVVRAALPFVRALELVQITYPGIKDGWEKELELQKALAELEEGE